MGKDWWKSKTIITQLVAIMVTLAGIMGLDLTGIQAALVTVITGVITIVIRFMTNEPIKQSALGKNAT